MKIRYLAIGVVAFALIAGFFHYFVNKTEHRPAEPIFHSPQVEQRLRDWREQKGRDPESLEEWREACRGLSAKAVFGTVCQETYKQSERKLEEIEDGQ